MTALLRKKLVYLGIVVLFVAAIFFRQQQIRQEQNAPVRTTYLEWARNGKPVEVLTLQRQDIPSYTKFTVTKTDNRHYTGYVTRQLQEKLKAGQPIKTIAGVSALSGTVREVAAEADIANGLYLVTVELEKELPALADGQPLIINVTTGLFPLALAVDSELIEKEASQIFLWIVDTAGRAQKRLVQLSAQAEDLSIISGGLTVNERIIIRGQTLLNPGDKILIVSSH